ncbi:hypothetical protein JHK87_000576 [Glycine soja]|nr:hypothetical protein JHK87_000576 [Glycine soja]
MEDHRYLGPNPWNVDFLVRLLELRRQTCHVNNVDPNKYGFYDGIYNFAVELGLLPCNPFIMWFRCANGNYRPLANDSNVMLMYVKNPNSSYIHLYATKNKDEFWHEPLFIEVVPTVIEPFIELVNQPVNACMYEAMNDVVNEAANASMNEAMNEHGLSGGSSPDIDSEYVGLDEELSYANDMSDFEEKLDCIGVVHSDSDMEEIYEEKGLRGNNLNWIRMGRPNFLLGSYHLSGKGSDFVGENGDWNIQLISPYLPTSSLDSIRAIPPPNVMRSLDERRYVAGRVLRDFQGKVLFSFAANIGFCSVLHVEFWAIYMGVSVA